MSKRDEIKKVIDLQLERELHELNDPALEPLIRRNEEFVDTELDEAKAAVLDEMQAEAAKLRRSIPNLQISHFGKKCPERNGYVRLLLPCPVFITAEPVVNRLARLYALAEGVSLAAAEGRLILTFHIFDLWK